MGDPNLLCIAVWAMVELLKEKTGEQLAKKKVSPPKQASGTSMPMPGATQKERRSNLRAVRRILSQWKK